MKSHLKLIGMCLLSALLAIGIVSVPVSTVHAQGQSNLATTVYPPMLFTATAQTDTQALGSFQCVVIQEKAATATTFTFQVGLSNDRGVTYTNAAVAPYVGSATIASVLTATAISNNTSTWYVVNVAGFTNIRIVTSSTFTATGVQFTLTASTGVCPGKI